MARVLHFDPFSGISGDMTLAALLDAGAEVGVVTAALASLGLPIQVSVEKVRKGGFAATRVIIDAPEQQQDRHLPEIEAIIGRGTLTAAARELAVRIFRRLAEAEAAVHGMPLERVHFHEVGALDSIADIVGVAVALDQLDIRRCTSRAVATGSGMVQCAHGRMPVPTPATAELLKGAPLAPCPIKAELTTPTGAAILAVTVSEWVETPPLRIAAVGHGAGTKDFLEQPNLLRIFLGEAANPDDRDTVWVLETNLDDVPGEVIGHTVELLFDAGALDVFTTAIFMKKNRPGVLLSVLVPDALVESAEAIIFRQTQTFGIRRQRVERSKLRRETVSVETPWGAVRGKRGWREGLQVLTPEYEDCARLARQHGLPLRAVYDADSERSGEPAMTDTPEGMSGAPGSPQPAPGVFRLLVQCFGLALVLIGAYYGLGIVRTVLGFLRDPESLQAPAEAMAVVLGLEKATVPLGDTALPAGRSAGMIALLLWYALASLIVWKMIQVGGGLAVATFNERREFYGAMREMLLALRREKEEAARGGG